ncbi:MAG: ABC transporter permease [Chloroflexi bacterium]|nr:ABC transporter permease [Chloroflexota bacterium]
MTIANDDTERTGGGLPPAESEERIYVASQWQLMWWRFRRHKAAMVSTVIIFLLIFVAVFSEFLAPYDPLAYSVAYTYAPPQRLRFSDPETGFTLRPFVYGLDSSRDPRTLRPVYTLDTERKYPIRLFVHGAPYRMWGLWDTDLRLFGIDDPTGEGTLFLFGSDRQGRDVFSRTIYGTRVSMSIGLIGVFLSLVLGILIGGFSGYYDGLFDDVVQRIIEFIRSVPSIPLWMALSAALPPSWPTIRIYFGITIILSLVGWTGMARVVRGRFLSLRSEDFVMAAKLSGASETRIVARHMVPSFTSHIIASITLSIPEMILSETSLSFLGIGLRSPVISWGVLLQEAQNVQAVVLAPWLFLPGLFVVVTVLTYNFMGDGLRDAADPYAR